MSNNWIWKKTNYEDYDYISKERQNKYYKYSYNPKSTKINNYPNQKTQKFQNYHKNNMPIENKFSSHYGEINYFQPFYPQNLENTQKQSSDDYNQDEQYIFSTTKNNDCSNCENPINNHNYENNKNGSQFQNNNLNEKISTLPSENLEKKETEEQYQKPKKYGINNIPHPKRRKNHGSCYISGKKLLPFKQKKEEEKLIKKERKLSISSAQNNFDSAKHSISTLNTSSSSYKEKDVLNEDKKNNNHIDMNNINNTKNIKNKFDEKLNEIKKNEPQINPYNENTEILKVNVKLPNNQTVIFNFRRFDDLFLTIKLFCEINSIDEKFIKPLIIKSLSTINTIYQLYNSKISYENLHILKTIKSINDNMNDMNR